MISSKTVKGAVIGLLSLVGGATLSAQFETTPEFWNQPHIRKAFLGSYEPNTTTEPSLTEEEQVVLKEIIDFMGQGGSNQEALKMILPHIKPGAESGSTAAFEFVAANFYATEGDLKKAVEFYDQAIAKFPNFLRAIKNAAIMRVRLGQFEAAIKGFTRSIELGAKDTTTMGLLGLCYVNTNKYFSAETAYREAIVLDPSQKDWQLGLAKSLLSQAKYTDAIAVLEQMLAEDPENELLWSSTADAYLALDEPETAVAIHEIIDRLGKSSAESLKLMGDIYMSRELSELALDYYQRAIAKDPNQEPAVHVDVAEVLTARGAYDEATQIMSDIRNTFTEKLQEGQKLRLLRLEAQIALATQQGERVIPILEELIEKDPLDGQALLLLAEFYSNQGDDDGYARADLYFERATRVQEWEVRALISWARSYVSRERYDQAIPLLERAQTLEPQDYIGRYLDQVRKVNSVQVR